jgi:N-acetylglucosamine kinase-like BadF-type ATPase
VDGGQSGTRALVGDETGRVLGAGSAEPFHQTASAISDAVRAALQQGGLAEVDFEAACFGFSGGSSDKEALARSVVSAKSYFFTHDAHIALTGATGGEAGVIVIAGTGSIAFGRNTEGRTARAGGWGYIFGDEGGAFDMVRQALRSALRFEEGWGTRTALVHTLAQATGARDANDLLHRFYTDDFPRDRIASFAGLVDEAARTGDPVARDILNGAAQALATFAGSVRHQLFQPGEPVRISYAGGVFRSSMILERFKMLAELEDGNRVWPPVHGPAAGALIEAYRLASVKCTLKES